MSSVPVCAHDDDRETFASLIANPDKDRRRARFTLIPGGKMKRVTGTFGKGPLSQCERGIFGTRSFRKSFRVEDHIMLERIHRCQDRDDTLASRIQDCLDEREEGLKDCRKIIATEVVKDVPAACHEGREQIRARLKLLAESRAKGVTPTTPSSTRLSKERLARMAINTRRRRSSSS